jgi:voltage-gated potassium channel
MKQRVFRLVDRGEHGSKLNLLFDYTILTLIILNMISIVLDTVDSINQEWHQVFYAFELFSVAIFTIEYALRLYSAEFIYPARSKWISKYKFMTSTFGIIDLLAIVPFYLPLVVSMDVESLRLLLLLRFVRVFKINRYNKSTKLVFSVIKEKKGQLATTVFITMMLLITSSVLMFHVEGKVQPEAFPNIVATFWWAISTLTTVGYGDVVPLTSIGKLISGLLAFLGLGVIALPTGIISSGFLEKSRRGKKERFCPHCGEKLTGLN